MAAEMQQPQRGPTAPMDPLAPPQAPGPIAPEHAPKHGPGPQHRIIGCETHGATQKPRPTQ